SVHLGAAACDAVELVLAADADDAIDVSAGGIDLGVEDHFFGRARFGQDFSFAIDDLRMSGEGKAAFFAHAISGSDEDMVLRRAYLWRVLPVVGGVGPVGRDGQQLGALQLEHASRLGEAAIEADVHTELRPGNVEERERQVTGSGEAVHAEM